MNSVDPLYFVIWRLASHLQSPCPCLPNKTVSRSSMTIEVSREQYAAAKCCISSRSVSMGMFNDVDDVSCLPVVEHDEVGTTLLGHVSSSEVFQCACKGWMHAGNKGVDWRRAESQISHCGVQLVVTAFHFALILKHTSTMTITTATPHECPTMRQGRATERQPRWPLMVSKTAGVLKERWVVSKGNKTHLSQPEEYAHFWHRHGEMDTSLNTDTTNRCHVNRIQSIEATDPPDSADRRVILNWSRLLKRFHLQLCPSRRQWIILTTSLDSSVPKACILASSKGDKHLDPLISQGKNQRSMPSLCISTSDSGFQALS